MTINTGTLTSAIGDRVWLDANNNGIQDAGETGVAGVTVRLLDAIGRVLATQQTDANGNYLFTQIGAGQYAIEVVKPGDYSFTLRDAGTDGGDSDVDTTTGRSGLYTLALGEQNLTVDAGLQAPPCPPTASLGDKVWIDSNANGQQDAGEAGLPVLKAILSTTKCCANW
jgi:serine-aspartate repeat-containing protein C/D/E